MSVGIYMSIEFSQVDKKRIIDILATWIAGLHGQRTMSAEVSGLIQPLEIHKWKQLQICNTKDC